MKKIFEISVPASSFFTNDALGYLNGKTDKKHFQEKAEEEQKSIRSLFYLDEEADLFTTEVTLRCRLEHFLWSLFESVKKPQAPLKLVAFNKRLETIAEKLNETVEIENRLPVLSADELELIKPILDDENLFTKIQCKYEAVPAKDDCETQFIGLPITNTLTDITFLETLDMVVGG